MKTRYLSLLTGRGIQVTSNVSRLLPGIYIFQLVDNHAATYSALMLGAAEVGSLPRVTVPVSPLCAGDGDGLGVRGRHLHGGPPHHARLLPLAQDLLALVMEDCVPCSAAGGIACSAVK